MKSPFAKVFKLLVYILVFAVGVCAGGFGVPVVKAKLFPSAGEAVVQYNGNQGVGPIIDLDEFLVNLEGGGIVKAEISLEGINAKAEKELTSKEIFIRDKIINVLCSKKIEEIKTPQGQEQLKKELLEKLNAVCNDQINEVLFKNFVYAF